MEHPNIMNRFGDIDVSFRNLSVVDGYHSSELVTIEKALEPIVFQNKELPRYIQTAKKCCHFPSEHGLSKDESAAVYIYSMEWGTTSLYRVLNEALRSENRQALIIWFPYLKLFDTALDKLPTVEERLWRGVPLDIGRNYTENQVVTWWGINSCSSSVNIIKNFLNNHENSTLFLIEAVNGKQLSGYTKYPNENEVILRMGTKFRVKSDPLKSPTGSYLVHLIEVNGHEWNQNAITIAGKNGRGNQTDQFYSPRGISIDDGEKCIYVADHLNNRIIKWKYGAKYGQVVVGANTDENQLDQLNGPTDVIFDNKTDSLIICDRGNRRVVKWFHQNGINEQIIISEIDCQSLAMDDNGDLYVSDYKKHEVRRWKMGDANGLIVAGGNGEGNHFNQLDYPTFIFVDQNHSLYVSDRLNHRVMKWLKNANEGIVVAGGQGQGHGLTQLSNPRGLSVDHLGNLYVADSDNQRVMRWSKESKKGSIIVGGNGPGIGPHQFNGLRGLSFDRQGNLYVVDNWNNRIQKFEKNAS